MNNQTTINQPQSVTLTDLIPYSAIPDQYPHLFTQKSWIWMVKQRRVNGLHPAFRKVGKSLFVNTKVLAKCIDMQLDSSKELAIKEK